MSAAAPSHIVACSPSDAVYIGLDTARAQENFGYAMPDVLPILADGRWPVDDGGPTSSWPPRRWSTFPILRRSWPRRYRCLTPGGRLILTVPFAARWHYIPHDYWRFTPSSLRMLLERAGFEQIVVNGRGNETTVACYKALALLLPLVLPQDQDGAPHPSPVGLLLLPLILPLAIVANRSLRAPAGDDCLGFTAFAIKPAAEQR